ncbi:MAG: hypothetical protein JWP21_894 [Tardiphaga sp.]|nr:hypothetical protein [Tardiphaga sp.]
MKFRSGVLAVAMLLAASSAQAQSLPRNWAWKKLPDPRGEFVRLCAPHMVGRWAHPESVCICLHDHAVAGIEDSDLREALLRGISETGVPAIENDWVPATKRPQINAAFTQIARPTLQCMFDPAT